MLSNSYAKKRLADIDKRLADLKVIAKKFPPGRLHCSRSRGKTQFYQITGTEGRKNYSRKYLGKKSENITTLLARKEIYKAEYLDLLDEQKSLCSLLKIQDGLIKKSATSKLEKRKMLSELFANKATLDDDARAWANAEYQSSAPHQEERTKRAIDGTMVRSKAEADIIMLLDKYGIPYRYECDLISNGNVIGCPDFTIMHPLTHEIFIWEHFGMLDDRTYVNRNIYKVKDYIGAGWFPMINFIITGETGGRALDVTLIDALIRQFFLQ